MGIAIIGLITAIVIVLIIIFAYKTAFKRADHKAAVEGLQSWIKKAKAEGYSHAQMEKMLIKHGWDAHIVRKAIYENG